MCNIIKFIKSCYTYKFFMMHFLCWRVNNWFVANWQLWIDWNLCMPHDMFSFGYQHNSIRYWEIMRRKQCGAFSPILHQYWENIEMGKHVSFSVRITKPLLVLKSKIQLFLVSKIITTFWLWNIRFTMDTSN